MFASQLPTLTTPLTPLPPRPIPVQLIAPHPSILDAVFRPFSSYRHHQVPESVPPDSPTPVPMPPTGADSNAVVSNQGDTIELVIHSPHKGPLHHRRPSGWFASFTGGGGGDGDEGDRGDHRRRPEAQLFSITGEEDEQVIDEKVQQQKVIKTAASPSSSDGYDDALSILSASELVNADDLGAIVMAAGAPAAGAGVANNEGTPRGRLADAFSEKWGGWLKGANSSDDGSAEGGETGRRDDASGRPSPGDDGTAKTTTHCRLETDGRACGRSAREFDDEALLLSPFDPRPVLATSEVGSAAAVDATDSDNDGNSRFASPLSRSSSSGSVYSERWLWRRQDGVKYPTSSNNSSGAALSQRGRTAVAGGLEKVQNPQGNTRSHAERKMLSRRESEEGLNAKNVAAGVGVQCKTKGAATVPPRDTQRHDGASGEPTTASLLEVDI